MPLDEAPEHEFEAEPGLPQPLPPGERLLWQGTPLWRVMARDALHTRLAAIYFALLLLARAATVLADGGRVVDAAVAAAWLSVPALLALVVLHGAAWLTSRASVYTITDRRVVMRIGVVLSVTFNLPYARIESAALHTFPDGSGNVSLQLAPGDQIAYVHLWPHARPWRLRRTQPMLRAVPQARHVAQILATALAQRAGADRTSAPAAVGPARATATARAQQALAA